MSTVPQKFNWNMELKYEKDKSPRELEQTLGD